MSHGVLEREGVGFDSDCGPIVEFCGVDEIIDLFFAVVRDVGEGDSDTEEDCDEFEEIHTCYIYNY